MKWRPSIRIGDGTNKGKPVSLIKKIVAYNKSGPSAFLLVPGLRIKSYSDKIPFFWNVRLHHQASLPVAGPQSSS